MAAALSNARVVELPTVMGPVVSVVYFPGGARMAQDDDGRAIECAVDREVVLRAFGVAEAVLLHGDFDGLDVR